MGKVKSVVADLRKRLQDPLVFWATAAALVVPLLLVFLWPSKPAAPAAPAPAPAPAAEAKPAAETKAEAKADEKQLSKRTPKADN